MQIPFQALVEVVAAFGAGGKQAGGGEGAGDFVGEKPALHPQPQQIELGVVDDEGRLFQDRGERPEFVAGRPKVNRPDGATVTAEIAERSRPAACRDFFGRWKCSCWEFGVV